MKKPFKIGAIKIYKHKVKESDIAGFESGEVHPVYSTFALARDAEWACRLFVLEMTEADEEGIGTALSIQHKSPAKLGAELEISAKLEHIEGNKVQCSFQVKDGERLIAEGRQEQRILPKAKLNEIFKSI